MADQNRAMQALLNPESVVLIGVSRPGPGKSRVGGYAVLRNIQRGGFAGRLSIVHPSGEAIDGVPAVRTIGDLPGPHDVAVIALPAARVGDAIRECVEIGTHAFVILSSGFGEAGTAEGRGYDEELRALAEEHGLAISGPNSLGVVNFALGAWVGNFASLESVEFAAGGLAVVSQSGAIAGSLTARAAERGIGLSHIVSTGNETVTTSADVITALVDDPVVRVISLYLEGAHDGRALVKACRTARAAGKPVVVYKVGETEVGARAAMSHTAKLAGKPALYRGALEQAGVVHAASLDELVETPMAFLAGTSVPDQPLRRVAVVSISGGLGAVTADGLVQAGMEVPVLAEATQQALQDLDLPFGAIVNPVDTGGATQRRQDVFQLVAKILGNDPGIDAIVVSLASRFQAAAQTTADDLEAAAAAAGVPLYVAWFTGADNAEFVQRLRATGAVPCFDNIDACVRALSGAGRVAQAFPPPGQFAGPDVILPSGEGVLDEVASKALLAEYGLPLPRESLARTVDAALQEAAEIGYPVALKIVSADVPHKAAVGGVRLGVADETALMAAYRDMVDAVAEAVPGACIEGVLVSEMLVPERELLVGVYRDETFGLVLGLGQGGSQVEELDQVVFRLLPLSRAEIDDICRTVLDDAPDLLQDVGDVVERVADFAWSARDRLSELDINPLVTTRSGAVRALDAVVRLAPQTEVARDEFEGGPM